MGRGTAGLVIGITFLFYIIAFALAVAAVEHRSLGSPAPADPTTGLLTCQYTPKVATGLAIAAFIFLVIAQAFIMIVTRCLCCGSGYKPGAARTFAVVSFIFSWLSFIIAAALLIGGATVNNIRTKGYYPATGPNITCQSVRKSVFGGAAAFTFFTMLLSELYYVLISKSSGDGGWNSYNNGAPTVGMAAYT